MEVLPTGDSHLSRFLGRTDHAVGSAFLGEAGQVQSQLPGIGGVAEPGQGFPIQAGEHGHRQQLGAPAPTPVSPDSLRSGLDHGRASLSVDVDQPDIQRQQGLQGPLYGVRDIVQLEVEEYRSEGLDLLHESWALCTEELETDLQHANPALELAGEGKGSRPGWDIQGNDEAISGGEGLGHAGSGHTNVCHSLREASRWTPMRLPCLMPFVPMLLVAQAAVPLPLPEAEAQYLQAWDLRVGNEAIAVPFVVRKDQPSMRWLTAAASQDLPVNPFPRNGQNWREAESLRHFLQAPPERWAADLDTLPLTLNGSYLALWRWGQPRVRDGRMDKPLRLQWEDRLLGGNGPGMVRDSALRHALCFALAEADGARFSQLKNHLEEGFPELFPQFQNAFSLLGAPAPVVHLWLLPGMESVDLSLGKLGGAKVRLESDPGEGLPVLPADTVWVVPTREGSQPAASSYLEGSSLAEANQLVPRLEAAKCKAYLAPVRSVFETYALMYFPLQIELDADGLVLRIRMGDAALAKRP